VEPIVPQSDCLILTKVRHNAFYATALDYLLGRLETSRIVLTGQVTEQCILYSALLGDAALKMMSRNMRAALRPAADYLC
jgi:nicotinamidase-related amidase